MESQILTPKGAAGRL